MEKTELEEQVNEGTQIQEQPVQPSAEEPAQQAPKMFTQEEVDKMMANRVGRLERKHEREYGPLMQILRTGTGKETPEEIAASLKDFWKEKGVTFSDQPAISEKEVAALAKLEADEIIRGGMEDVDDEITRLTKLGAENMSPKERVLCKTLAEYRQGKQRTNEFEKAGISQEVCESPEFLEFASQYKASTPAATIAAAWGRTQPQENIRTMGSMKSVVGGNTGVKDFYTPEDVDRLSPKDMDNPLVMQRVRESMLQWK